MTVEAPTAPPPVTRARARGRHGVHGRRVRRLPVWIAVIQWIVVGALALVAGMRLFAWDDLEPFAVLNDVTAFVYLPAWIVAAVAIVGRRPFLAGGALLLVVAQIAFVAPELTAAQPVPGWATHAPALRLLDANVYNVNPSMAGYASQIETVHPDLMTMEEATPTDVDQLERDGALAGLPYRVEIKRYDPAAFLVASRYPLTGANVLSSYARPLLVQVTVHLPSGPLPLWVVHTIAPLPSSFSQWKGQLALIDRALGVRGPAGLLMVGDFNATWGSKGFRDLLDAGMTDGAAVRGKAFEMTWSQTKPLLPPLVRIDHVLTGPGLAVTAIRTGPGPGSDHRDLVATVAVRS